MPINLLLKIGNREETKSYYRDILGFKVCDWEDGSTTARKEDCTIIFTTEELWPGNSQLTGTIYMFIDDVDSYYESIKDKVSVLWPIQNMDHGTREFGIKDCNGYCIAFAKKT